jgi:DNA 3'-phosphatase
MPIITLDLDHTIIKPADGSVFPQHTLDFELINEELYADARYDYVIVSNQAGIEMGHQSQYSMIERCKAILKQLPQQVKSIFFVPDFAGSQAVCVTRDLVMEHIGQGNFRKPDIGLVALIETIYKNSIVAHVGDRDEDQNFAINADVQFTRV